VTQIAAQQSTTGDQDRRKSPLLRSDRDLDTSALYSALKTADATPDAWSKIVWKNKAPPRVKFFAWLLSKSRIQCKKNLARKGIVDSESCDVCNSAAETTAHILFGCTSARQFWQAVGVITEEDWAIEKLMEIQCPYHIPQRHFGTFLLLCTWHIWKWRNSISIRNEQMNLNAALSACKNEAFFWGARLKPDDRHIASKWCTVLTNAMS
jgi:hypothetical protein